MNEGIPKIDAVTEPRELNPEEIRAAQESFAHTTDEHEPVVSEAVDEHAVADEEKIDAVKERLASHAELPVQPEAPAMQKEASPASNMPARESATKKLFNSLNFSKKGPFSRENVLSSGKNEEGSLVVGLNAERAHNEEIRSKVFPAASAVGGLGILGGSGLGFATAGLAGVGAGFVGGIAFVAAPALALGGLGWLGLKTYQGLKQRKHRKEFNQLYLGGQNEPGALNAEAIRYK